ncbi:hypothetical protein J3U64_02510 [Snodgrassella sp. B3800]|uniref:hypothetical protein n=1 Tax=Snodgrassella sp. B3800 TaxID=2818039 RepID=UPI00226A8418|nr:hypothetical protein [Snodgrassella sp. B3800]MCX8746338.1 hypothetical protein [Snodgrassella sp. B3800]
MRNLLISYAKAVCLTGLLLLAGCSDKDKDKAKQQPVPFTNQDRFGRYDSIGNLGGKPVSIPDGVVFTWVHYVGDPGDFDRDRKAGEYKRPPITYQLPIDGFDFQYRVTDGAIKIRREQTDIDYMNDNKNLIPKGKPFPWGYTIVYNLYSPKQPKTFNQWFNNILESSKENWDFGYSKKPDKVFGLTYYQANNGIDPSTNQPWTDNIAGKDLYIYRDANNNIKTLILCDIVGKIQYCHHEFMISNFPIEVSITYNRVYLKLWQQTEKNIAAILDSWVVTNEGKLIKKQAGK